MKDLAKGHWPGFTLGQQLTSDKNQDSGTWHSVRVQRCDFMLAALERQGCQLANDCLGTVALVSLKTKH